MVRERAWMLCGVCVLGWEGESEGLGEGELQEGEALFQQEVITTLLFMLLVLDLKLFINDKVSDFSLLFSLHFVQIH